MFAPDDAQRLFELLVNVEAAKSGRSFLVTVGKGDGSSISGEVVKGDGSALDLLVEDGLGNRGEAVAWDEIETITITSP